jgi:adenylate cyclase
MRVRGWPGTNQPPIFLRRARAIAAERIQRRLAAILAADVVGYSLLMAGDEAGTLAALRSCRQQLIEPEVAAHGGRVVKLMGDGVLVEFASVVDAGPGARRPAAAQVLASLGD